MHFRTAAGVVAETGVVLLVISALKRLAHATVVMLLVARDTDVVHAFRAVVVTH